MFAGCSVPVAADAGGVVRLKSLISELLMTVCVLTLIGSAYWYNRTLASLRDYAPVVCETQPAVFVEATIKGRDRCLERSQYRSLETLEDASKLAIGVMITFGIAAFLLRSHKARDAAANTP